jgi:hypothetical protein
MRILQCLADKILKPSYKHSPPPFQASWAFPSMSLSAIDESRPSARLLKIGIDAVKAAANHVSYDDLAKHPNSKVWLTVWPGEHYNLLGGLVHTIQPKVVVEIGTAEGLSALAMKKYLPADGKVVTFDIKPWNTIPDTMFKPEDFTDGRLEQRLGDLAEPACFEAHRSLFEQTDFFFIDGPKDNNFEYRLLDLLKTVQFKTRPILMFDDTRLWSMLKFWHVLPYPKLDLTSFGHSSGSGIVEFSGL